MTGKTQTEEFAPAKEVPDLAHYIGMIRLPPEHAADGVHTLRDVLAEIEPTTWAVMICDGII